MYDREKFLKALENKGYKARYFATGKEAADYVCRQVKGCTVGFGGSATIEELDLVDRLAENNTCFSPEMKYRPKELTFNEAALDTLRTDVFLLSVNGAAEDGTLVNIDGTGNRVGSSLFGHKKVYFIFSENKVMP
ncbi:MAG: lactate utilization protein, partial [Clostridia bacterium]|nr:lactate utilization protein [Clostridia bacterium]